MMKDHNYERRVMIKCLAEGIELPKKEEPKKEKKGKAQATGTKQFEETALMANEEVVKVTEKDYDKKF